MAIGSAIILSLIFLSLEAFRLERARRELKWRIAVGGVRGKSSVTRLIAGALREGGIRVIARTTGSRPVVIFPDGHEEEVRRLSPPNILEGKGFLRLAKKEAAEALVVELMAIQPECLEAEVKKIFKPHYLLFTNFRLDHREELGRTRREVAQNLLRAAFKGVNVFLLEEQMTPEIEEILERKGAKIIKVNGYGDFSHSKGLIVSKENELGFKASELIRSKIKNSGPKELRANFGDDFADNIRLALAVSRHLGLKDEVAISGMQKATPDFGSLKIWEAAVSPGHAPGYLVSAFAANEPESSSLVIKKLKELIPWEGKKVYGLLLLRRDRGDRTKQWCEAVAQGFLAEFDELFLCGAPQLVWRRVKRRLKEKGLTPISRQTILLKPRIYCLNTWEVMNLTQKLSQRGKEPWILVGLGNIVGLGSRLVDLWEKEGKRIHG